MISADRLDALKQFVRDDMERDATKGRAVDPHSLTVLDLLDEYERLRGLVREESGEGESDECTWCGWERRGGVVQHTHDCRAHRLLTHETSLLGVVR